MNRFTRKIVCGQVRVNVSITNSTDEPFNDSVAF